MEIKKVGAFSEEEFEALKQAGTILGKTATALEAKEIDVLAESSINLVNALKQVLDRIIK